MAMVKEALNFTTTRPHPEDRAWGAEVTNPDTGEKEWNGMVRMLMDGKADICSSGFTMIREREEVGFVDDRWRGLKSEILRLFY